MFVQTSDCPELNRSHFELDIPVVSYNDNNLDFVRINDWRFFKIWPKIHILAIIADFFSILEKMKIFQTLEKLLLSQNLAKTMIFQI